MTPTNTTIPFTNRRYLDAIADHLVIYDGAMGSKVVAMNSEVLITGVICT